MCLGFWGFFLISFQIFVSDAAIEAFLQVAIVLFQLDKSLAVSGMGGFQSTFLPHTDDVIVFWLQLFQERTGTLAEDFIGSMLAIGV